MKNPNDPGLKTFRRCVCLGLLLAAALSCDDDKDFCERAWDRMVECDLDMGMDKDDVIDSCRKSNAQMEDISDACWNAREDWLLCALDQACDWWHSDPEDPDAACYDELERFIKACGFSL